MFVSSKEYVKIKEEVIQMKILAYKKTSLWIIYLISAILGVILSVINQKNHLLLFIGILIFIVSLAVLCDYLFLPKKIIQLDDKSNLHLPKKIVISLKDVKNVSYHCSSSKGIQHPWGQLKLYTIRGVFSYRYVDKCVEVTQTLQEMLESQLEE